jgi:two-component sensor histidine kinase
MINAIRSRLFLQLAGAAILALLPVLAAIIYQANAHRAAVLQIGEQLLAQASGAIAVESQATLQAAEETLRFIVDLPAVQESDWAACQATVVGLHRAMERVAFIGVVDAAGDLVCPSLPSSPGASVADRPWFQNVRASLVFTVGEYAVGRTSGRPSIHLSYPVIRDGQFAGAANIALDVEWLARRLTIHVPSGELVSFILDSAGRVVAKNVPGGPALGAVVDLLPDDRAGPISDTRIRTTALDGVERMVALQPLIDAPGGSLWSAVGIEQAALLGPANNALVSALLVVGLSIVLAGAVLFLCLARLVLLPVKSLDDAARSLKQGVSPDIPEPWTTRNEMGALMASFADMANQIAEREQDRVELDRRQALLREVSHRVKNHLASLASMIQLERRNVAPESRQYLQAMHQRIMATAELYDLLAQRPSAADVSLSAYVERVCSQLMQVVGRDGIALHVVANGDVSLCPERAMAIGLYLNEVVTNSLKHAFPAGIGRIDVDLDASGPEVELRISDDGVGLGADAELGGLGMTIIRSMASQVKGRLVIEHDGGTMFSLSFPAGSRSKNDPEFSASGQAVEQRGAAFCPAKR